MGRRRRSKAKQHPPLNNTTTEMSPYINSEISPDITLIHILPRLPVKSLRRFQCVSKQWHSFLSTPEFAKMQLHRATTNQDHQSDHKIMVISTKQPYRFRIIDCENPKQNSLTTPNHRPLPFEIGYLRYKSILASFHGMVCIGIVNTWSYFIRYSDLVLWNPSTGECKTLSKPYPLNECYDFDGCPFGLYYSSCDDDYKLLRVTRDPNVYIYSLKSDSWRKVLETETFRPIRHYYTYDLKPISVLLNEKLYFLEEIEVRNYSLIWFDTKTEKLTEIETPFSSYRRRANRLSFVVIRGCIHLLATIFNSTNVLCELWRMDENEDGGWTKVETISGFSFHEHPLQLMRNGNWVVRSSSCGNVYQVSLKKKTKKKRCRLCSLRKLDIVIEERYMETLVSPNQYMIK